MSQACSEVLGEVRLTIRELLGVLPRDSARLPGLLDVGCWDGVETARLADLMGARAHGIEIFAEPASQAEARGIDVARIDLEHDRFPWPDESMDVVVVNQVFEHLKNIWHPMSEIHRVTRTDGWLVISVPNLASLHNRLLMLFGRQPTSIRTFGPHVRGYVAGEFARFVGLEGAWRIERHVGVGFYPFPARMARPLARAWAGASHTTVWLARKPPGAPRAPWTRFLASPEGPVQTFYAPNSGVA
jgi:methionine biosynthesis protein MetW